MMYRGYNADPMRTRTAFAALLLAAAPLAPAGCGAGSGEGLDQNGQPLGTPPSGLPRDFEPGLEATVYFDPPGPTFSGAVHVAMVEVDPDTGRVAIERYVVVEDCGPVVNPTIVEGQIHGAVVQGIGEALLERLVYDETGQLLTGTLMDYALPKAGDVPSFEIGHLETPSPTMPTRFPACCSFAAAPTRP